MIHIANPLLFFYFQVVLVFTFIKYERAKYGKYTYPIWADTVGWMLTLASITPIFAIAAYKFARANGATMKEVSSLHIGHRL